MRYGNIARLSVDALPWTLLHDMHDDPVVAQQSHTY